MANVLVFHDYWLVFQGILMVFGGFCSVFMVFKVFSWFSVFQVKYRQQCEVLLNHQDQCFAMFFWLAGHYMRLFLMVANHRSSTAMFAMNRPSLAECITVLRFCYFFFL